MDMTTTVYFALYRAIDKYNSGKECKISLSDDWDNSVYADVYIGYTQKDYSYEEAENVAEEILYAAKLANTITSMNIEIVEGSDNYQDLRTSPEARQMSKDILDVLNMENTREFRRYISQLARDVR